MLSFKKKDVYDQDLNPGDVCIRQIKDGPYRKSIEFCVYKGEVRGNKSKGTFGRFITPRGIVSLKYTSVIFVFDTASDRRSKAPEISGLVRRFYEDVR